MFQATSATPLITLRCVEKLAISGDVPLRPWRNLLVRNMDDEPILIGTHSIRRGVGARDELTLAPLRRLVAILTVVFLPIDVAARMAQFIVKSSAFSRRERSIGSCKPLINGELSPARLRAV